MSLQGLFSYNHAATVLFIIKFTIGDLEEEVGCNCFAEFHLSYHKMVSAKIDQSLQFKLLCFIRGLYDPKVPLKENKRTVLTNLHLLILLNQISLKLQP